MLWLYIIIVVVGAYLLGCLNGAIIVSTYLEKKDIRNFGSGNAGLTNYYRTFGGTRTLLVLLGDVLKCVLATLLGGWLLGMQGYPEEGKMLAGVFVLAGHMFPVFFKFQGGKGVLSSAALALMMDWRVFLAVIGIFIVILLITKYVSLASICAAVSFVPVMAIAFNDNITVVIMTVFISAALVFMHRANIARLIRNEETKFSFHKNR